MHCELDDSSDCGSCFSSQLLGHEHGLIGDGDFDNCGTLDSDNLTGVKRPVPESSAEPAETSEEQRCKRNSRSRGWVFTAHAEFDLAAAEKALHSLGSHLELRYGIVGCEIAPKTGRRHCQGYVYRGTKLSFKQISSALDESFGVHCYCAAARGDHEQNRDYCAKDGSFAEYGTLPRPGNRSDLGVIAKLIDQGATMTDVARSNPAAFIRYHGGLNVMNMMY